MYVYSLVIFFLLFIFVRTITVRCVCGYKNFDDLFKTRIRSIITNIMTNMVSIILGFVGYMFLIKMGL